MSVTVHYLGGFGNNLFQYICARLFSMENGLRLLTAFNHPHIVPMTTFEGGVVVDGPAIGICDGMAALAHPYAPNPYRFVGYFQKGPWYTSRREKIESFAKPQPVQRNTKDVVMHLRLGDFKQCRIAIHPSWYLEILGKVCHPGSGRRLFIVTNEADPDYLSFFRDYNPHVVSTNYGHDWNFLREFETIICSNSTFAWWAAFFGRPSRVYTFKRWIGNPAMELDVLENQVIVDGRFLHE